MNLVEQRDTDLLTLDIVKNELSQSPGINFVVSGSYAIEALTGTAIEHNDMDTNVFADKLTQAMIIAPALLSKHQPDKMGFLLHKQTDDRLEYDVRRTSQSSSHTRRLEIHLVEATKVGMNVFNLNDERKNKISQVTLVEAEMKDSNGKVYLFQVKSLAYSLATWALRISDMATSQIRSVRDSDLEYFSLLLKQGATLSDVIYAMRLHPQMPDRVDPENIYKSALANLEKKAGKRLK